MFSERITIINKDWKVHSIISAQTSSVSTMIRGNYNQHVSNKKLQVPTFLNEDNGEIF